MLTRLDGISLRKSALLSSLICMASSLVLSGFSRVSRNGANNEIYQILHQFSTFICMTGYQPQTLQWQQYLKSTKGYIFMDHSHPKENAATIQMLKLDGSDIAQYKP